MRAGFHLALFGFGSARARYLARSGEILFWTADRARALAFATKAEAERFRAETVAGPVRVCESWDV